MSFFTNGHAASCGVPKVACTCPRLYVITGLLGMLTGTIQIVMGYIFGGGLSLTSDGTHAGADGATDFLAAAIAVWVLRNPHLAKTLETAGRKIIALALVGSAFWIIAEAVERVNGTHTVVPLLLAIGGAGGACVDAYRLRILRKAQDVASDGLRVALIAHARSDFWRSVIAAGIGIVLVVGEVVFASAEFKNAITYLDLALSVALSLYMFILAKGIWRGEHVHTPTDDAQHGDCDNHHHN